MLTQGDARRFILDLPKADLIRTAWATDAPKGFLK